MTDGPFDYASADNWVSFSFTSDTGYGKVQGTVHGSPDFVAAKFAIKDFDGKVSTLMKQATEIDTWWKTEHASKQGKA